MLTLGIDPGLARIGYGVVSSDGDTVALLDYGCLETHAGTPYADRLKYIYDGVRRLVRRYKPDAVALESLFFFRNARTVMKVSEARGVIVLAVGTCHVPAFEYTPQQVKQAVSSYGMETKRNVEIAVRQILGVEERITPDDTADAIAIALCHTFTGAYREAVLAEETDDCSD
ncbi:MAG TPA: crossover junction endodeoxyribonuclease RuvC [Clostridia bacterium]|nr:crossover junction endodeoxyribonuclease RuvC [Clostridia bacterium]